MTTTKMLTLVTLLAASTVLATEARAALIPNGLNSNSLNVNGIPLNGIRMNAISTQGMAMNSLRPSDAIDPNRLHLRAIRLPGE
jgi:hypothetical protein